MVANRHAHGAVGVHHLFGADHLNLVGVGVQAELGGALGNLVVVFDEATDVVTRALDGAVLGNNYLDATSGPAGAYRLRVQPRERFFTK